MCVREWKVNHSAGDIPSRSKQFYQLLPRDQSDFPSNVRIYASQMPRWYALASVHRFSPSPIAPKSPNGNANIGTQQKLFAHSLFPFPDFCDYAIMNGFIMSVVCVFSAFSSHIWVINQDFITISYARYHASNYTWYSRADLREILCWVALHPWTNVFNTRKETENKQIIKSSEFFYEALLCLIKIRSWTAVLIYHCDQAVYDKKSGIRNMLRSSHVSNSRLF